MRTEGRLGLSGGTLGRLHFLLLSEAELPFEFPSLQTEDLRLDDCQILLNLEIVRENGKMEALSFSGKKFSKDLMLCSWNKKDLVRGGVILA